MSDWDLDLGNADLMSLKIGRFHDRHPCMIGEGARALDEDAVMREVEKFTRGAHLVGAVPSFDAEVLGNRMRDNWTCPSWHYHPIDIEAMAVGWLAGKGEPPPELPWKSDDLAKACGVEPPSDEERHTALGDARWVKRWYEAITNHPQGG